MWPSDFDRYVLWIDHLRATDAGLVELLTQNVVVSHDFVIGDIACGNLKNRNQVLALSSDLPKCPLAMPTEILFFIERYELMGRGIGYIDAGLLAAATLGGCQLWTRDKRLAALTDQMGRSYRS